MKLCNIVSASKYFSNQVPHCTKCANLYFVCREIRNYWVDNNGEEGCNFLKIYLIDWQWDKSSIYDDNDNKQAAIPRGLLRWGPMLLLSLSLVVNILRAPACRSADPSSALLALQSVCSGFNDILITAEPAWGTGTSGQEATCHFKPPNTTILNIITESSFNPMKSPGNFLIVSLKCPLY